MTNYDNNDSGSKSQTSDHCDSVFNRELQKVMTKVTIDYTDCLKKPQNALIRINLIWKSCKHFEKRDIKTTVELYQSHINF